MMTLDGIDYRSAAEVCRACAITRQTLWRWRSEGQVPTGRRYRGRLLLFTAEEYGAIERYARRIEPTAPFLPATAGDRKSP